MIVYSLITLLFVLSIGFGRAETGKTYSLMTFWQLLIDGSYSTLSNTTPKAFNKPGREHCGDIKVFEETLATMIGGNISNFQKGKNDGSNDTDGVSILKDFMTEGTGHFAANNGLKDNVQVHGSYKVYMECVWFFATNLTRSQVSQPILTRCHVTDFTASVRELNGKNNVNENADRTTITTDFATRCHVIQGRMMLLYNAFTAKLASVNCQLAGVVIQSIMREADRCGCNSTTLKRTLQRLTMLNEVLCMIGALDAVFDMEYCPIAHERFSNKQILLTRKYLVVHGEHLSIALGLCQSAYENPVMTSILTHAKENLFKVQLDTRILSLRAINVEVDDQGGYHEIGTPIGEEYIRDNVMLPGPADPRLMVPAGSYQNHDGFDHQYYIYKYAGKIKEESVMMNGRTRLDMAISHFYDTMPVQGRPSFYEVDAVFKTMADQIVKVRNFDGTFTPVFKLVVNDTQMKIALPCLDMPHHDLFKNAFLRVMRHPHTDPHTYLWGKTGVDQLRPYMMPMLDIYPKTNSRTNKKTGVVTTTNLLTVRNATYFNAALIKQTINFTEGVHAHSFAPRATPALSQVFSKYPVYVINKDLDMLAVRAHLIEKHISRQEGDTWPAADPALQAQQEQALMEEEDRWEDLATYPEYPSLKEEEANEAPERGMDLANYLLQFDSDPDYVVPADLHISNVRKRIRDDDEKPGVAKRPRHEEEDGMMSEGECMMSEEEGMMSDGEAVDALARPKQMYTNNRNQKIQAATGYFNRLSIRDQAITNTSRMVQDARSYVEAKDQDQAASDEYRDQEADEGMLSPAPLEEEPEMYD